MLVISRRDGESLLIRVADIEIELRVLRGGRCKLGVIAPECVCVLRSELAAKIDQNGPRRTRAK